MASMEPIESSETGETDETVEAAPEMLSETVDDTDRIDYRFEIRRYHSFMRWAVDSKFLQQLASAGFYYTGKDDKVKCFDCNIVISGCMEYKDPRMEHRLNSPKCRFVRMLPSSGNVPIGVDPNKVSRRVPKMKEICEVDESYLILDSEIEVYFEDADVVKRVVIGDLVGAKHPKFAYYESRLATYVPWPVTVTQKKEDLAATGLICANDGDRVYCFYCDGGLACWQPQEDPIQEHIKWYPNCKYINRLQAKRQSYRSSFNIR
ncbi:E3 ubiquitin-protein ligase XIAP-like [Formica exsecta]|uniref:E3 ubiquitin-protein ligase XIAP-like n=1 Tax=Formica exsecta TaxID=72781 RepID=UPI00114209BA|nr:E3 ubiquitin-protein ligase XIAP-like [Formica exsecta]